MDKNGDGYIQYQEFLDEAHKVCIMISDLYLRYAFDLFDLSDDLEKAGEIPLMLLQNVMCGAISTKKKIELDEWEDFIEKFDENKDKNIDYGEFNKMMMSFHNHFAVQKKDTEDSQKQPLLKKFTKKAVLAELSHSFQDEELEAS